MDSHKPSAREILLLAAPHTWSASVMAAMLSVVLGYLYNLKINVLMGVCTFVITILMQSAVNAFDDYSDFVKGTDSRENSPCADDAVIVYGMSPRYALLAGICFLLIAALVGIYVVSVRGIVPLAIGIIGGITVAAYAFGRTPMAYLPVGELVSGFVMGGLVPLAGFYLQTGILEMRVLIMALPMIIGVALIMYTNNCCDIKRDNLAGRRTLPCLVGRTKANTVYRLLLGVWLLLPELILALNGAEGMKIFPMLVLISAERFSKQIKLPLGEETREIAMAGINSLNMLIGLEYMVALLIGGSI